MRVVDWHTATGESIIKRLSLCVFALWGRDLASVVCGKEVPYYRVFFFFKKICQNFVGTSETVRNREVSIRRGSTVSFILLYFTK